MGEEEIMGENNICSSCRFCLHQNKLNGYVCHNENSEHFGKIIDLETAACKDIDNHKSFSSLSLKEALKINARTDISTGTYYHYNLPDEEYKHAYVMLEFKSNADLNDWRDAQLKLFNEWLDMAVKDGDIEKSGADN